MKIVILDGYTTNPGDLSWRGVENLGDCTIYDRTAACDVEERAKDADILLVNKIKLPAEVLKKLPKVKYVGLLSTGTDVVDLDYCDAKGIVVCNIPAYSTGNVAQTVFAFILSKYSPVEMYNKKVHEGGWVNSPDFCFQDFEMSDMAGKTIGIIGIGKIGLQVARIAKAFDITVYAWSRTKKETPFVDKWFEKPEDMAKECDILTLHCPLTKDNRQFIDAKFLSNMKKSAILINTARGGLINDEDLAYYLNSGKIAGAFLDVLSAEPPLADNPLLCAKNCTITPHIAWATKEARQRLMCICEKNIEGFINGKTQNTVGKISLGGK